MVHYLSALHSEARNSRLVGDQNTIGKSADAFFNEAFPQTYPTVSLDDTDDIIEPDTDLGVRIIDFDATLPQDPAKTYVPEFLKEIPDSAALVSWRIDTNNGNVFFADDGAELIRPSESRLDVSAADRTPSLTSDYTLKLSMKKDEAGIETLDLSVPAGYSLGGQSEAEGTIMGSLTITFSTDNPWNAGREITVTTDLAATGAANEWELEVDYSTATGTSGTFPKSGATRTHTVSIVPPSAGVPGKMTLEMDRDSDDLPQNEATEAWELVIFDHPEDSGGAEDTGTNILTNPSVAAVYRWLTEEHTVIDVEDVVDIVAGNQAVIIK